MTKTKPEPVQADTKGTKTKAEPVQADTHLQIKTVTKTKAETKTKASAPAPAPVTPRSKIECECGLMMICNAAMTRHVQGAQQKQAIAKKEKQQAQGQTLGVNDMDLVDIDTYISIMLPRLYKKVRGLGCQASNNETFGFMKIEGDRDKMVDTIYNTVMPDVN